jgi:hypothetical protein
MIIDEKLKKGIIVIEECCTSRLLFMFIILV